MSQKDLKIDPGDVIGLRMFLYTVLDLIKDGKKETCKDIEDNIKVGITKYLINKYNTNFSKYYNSDNNDGIDEFYKHSDNKFNCGKNDGIDEFYKYSDNKFNCGKNDGIDEFYKYSDNKFDCGENDGLYWLIEQALNGLH